MSVIKYLGFKLRKPVFASFEQCVMGGGGGGLISGIGLLFCNKQTLLSFASVGVDYFSLTYLALERLVGKTCITYICYRKDLFCHSCPGCVQFYIAHSEHMSVH